MKILREEKGGFQKAEIECKTSMPAKSWDLRHDMLIRKIFGVVTFNFGDCLKFNSPFLQFQIIHVFP